MKKPVVFIVIDGLADLPMDGKTPLKEAKTPNLDWFAEHGMSGELNLTPKNLEVWSQIANVSLLGFDPKKFYIKRGPLEAVGADLPYKEGHLALRCNFATVDKNLVVTDRRGGRSRFGLDEIARYINKNVKIGAGFVLMRTYGHRAVLVIKEKLSDQISINDPYKTGEKVKPIEPLKEEAKRSAELVQDFINKARDVMEYHPLNAQRIDKGLPPANYLLIRDAGNRLMTLPNFPKKHGVKAVCISENGVMKATCMLAGFRAITVPELDTESALDFIFDNMENALTEYNFVYAHMKGVDEAAHDGDFQKKVKEIERIDEKIEAFKSFKGILVVTCDHITSCKLKSHVHGPVPILVFGKGADKVKTFDEFAVKGGKLKNYNGRKLWKLVFGK